MDFFARQDCARKKTCVLTIYFVIAVIAVVLSVYFVMTGIFGIIMMIESPDTFNEVFRWWNPHIFTGITMFVFLIVFGGSLAEVISLRYGGGAKVAEMMGARQLAPNAADLNERQLLNVVFAGGGCLPHVFWQCFQGRFRLAGDPSSPSRAYPANRPAVRRQFPET